jgi:hypothetical protein
VFGDIRVDGHNIHVDPGIRSRIPVSEEKDGNPQVRRIPGSVFELLDEIAFRIGRKIDNGGLIVDAEH